MTNGCIPVDVSSVELTPSGKIIKADLRHMARSQWLQRSKLLAESRL